MKAAYRTDIDGIRAVSVISVILFHLGYLPNGYLGVDIFFVISGYLITGIVFNEVEQNSFSVLKFYERRIRRIIPLVLFTTLTAFILGLLFMLPDDLENLCQSVFASNFSVNNILMLITSRDYWAVKNEFKPLMHTWSLGIEEQFYLFYPVIFFFLSGAKKKFILPLLLLLTLISMGLFFYSSNAPAKFYLLQYRFFELSTGGIGAIFFRKKASLTTFYKSEYLLFLMLLLVAFILFSGIGLGNELKVFLVTIFSTMILVLGAAHYESNLFYKRLLSNKLVTGIGKISFSLYMWHQIIFAFARYFIIKEASAVSSIVLSLIVLLLSIFTYYFIENPFRKKSVIKTKPLLIITGLSFVLITGMSFYIYAIGGIIRDVPELGISVKERPDKLNFFSSQDNIHFQYNEDVRNLNKPFTSNEKIKVFVIGDSYARDFANILLESEMKDKIELSYADLNRKKPDSDIIARFRNADFIFLGALGGVSKANFVKKLQSLYHVDAEKVWSTGTKDFGYSNGIFYNQRSDTNGCDQKTIMKKGVLETNNRLQADWGDKYINLIELIIDSEGKVMVFTPDCKFISQDTLHLTKSGAKFLSTLLQKRLKAIFHL